MVRDKSPCVLIADDREEYRYVLARALSAAFPLFGSGRQQRDDV